MRRDETGSREEELRIKGDQATRGMCNVGNRGQRGRRKEGEGVDEVEKLLVGRKVW